MLPVNTSPAGLIFALTTLLAILLFHEAARNRPVVLLVLLAWCGAQAAIGLSDFYADTGSMPPRFLLMVLPPLLLAALLFSTTAGRRFIDSLNARFLTLLHVVRLPVEVVLFLLFAEGSVPELMTFEGRNFDILAGLTAPLVFYFGYVKNRLGTNTLLAWNLICLGLLINIVFHAVLSAPSPFQQFAFEQPNTAVLQFPFVWLPSCLVPLVLFSHLALFRQLLSKHNGPAEA